MKVPQKDRADSIEITRLSLNMAEIYVDYQNADLINRVMDIINKKGWNINVKDICKIKNTWEKDWTSYYKSKEISKISAEDS